MTTIEISRPLRVGDEPVYVIALAEGAMTDHSKATFEDGVLEITMPAPPEVMRGRKLEISESRPTKK